MIRRSSGDRATLRDVAQASGVSLQTVSNVINNPERVAPDTFERVSADIARLGFRPNLAARSLRMQRAGALGIQIPAATQGRFGRILDSFFTALTLAAQEDEAHLIPFVADDPEPLGHYEQLLAAGIVDGFVLTDTHPRDSRPLWLRERGVPFVSFGRIWDDPSDDAWVDVDGRAGTEAATEHLLERGYGRIAFIGWPEGSATGDDRRAGWSATCARLGIDTTGLDHSSSQEVTAAQGVARKVLADLEPGDAIVCVSDTIALAVHLELEATGLRAGADIGVVGFDDCDFASVFGLTTVRQPVARIAAHLITRLRSPESVTEGQLITPTLVARRSTQRQP